MAMSTYPMTETIARRDYSYHGASGAGLLVVQIGKPAPFPDSPDGDWYCPFTIDGVCGHREYSIGGVDALQSLLLAISAIKSHLQLIAKGAKVTWLDDDLGMSFGNSDGKASD